MKNIYILVLLAILSVSCVSKSPSKTVSKEKIVTRGSASTQAVTFSSVTWANMLALPELIAKVSEHSRRTGIEACYWVGHYGAKMQVNLNLAIQQDGGQEENVLLLAHSLSNLVFGLNESCKDQIDRSKIQDKLIASYRGHLTLYRIVAPNDIERAIENVYRLKKYLSQEEIIKLKIPVVNTSELGASIPYELK